MITVMTLKDACKTYSNRTVKTVRGGYLLTPKDQDSTPPREPLVVDRRIFTDEHDNILNGAVPTTLSGADVHRVVTDIPFDLKGQPVSIIFISNIVIDGIGAFQVVRPSQATQFLLCTNYNRKHPEIGLGATRRYAVKQHHAYDFYKQSAKSPHRGQNFWRLSINMLSKRTIQKFDQAWAARILAVIKDYARQFPRDVDLISTCRKLVESPINADDAHMAASQNPHESTQTPTLLRNTQDPIRPLNHLSPSHRKARH